MDVRDLMLLVRDPFIPSPSWGRSLVPFLVIEIAFVGKAPGNYSMLLGGGYHGQRLNKIYRGWHLSLLPCGQNHPYFSSFSFQNL
jgi:hypothetical protein